MMKKDNTSTTASFNVQELYAKEEQEDDKNSNIVRSEDGNNPVEAKNFEPRER